jgi:hypothetical protein
MLTPSAIASLELIEVYSFYNKPVLFSCRDNNGLIFIGLSVGDSEEVKAWLYAQISLSRFRLAKLAMLGLREILSQQSRALFI